MAGKVHLGDVARDDSPTRRSEASQEHFHLQGGRVLGLVQNDKRAVQRSSSHVGQRHDFDDMALHVATKLVQRKHVLQRVVERPQIGVHLLTQVAGKESQSFTGLHSRTAQHDPFHLARLERGYGEGHGGVCLARTGRADREYDIVLPGLFDEDDLVRSLGRDGASGRREEHRVLGFVSRGGSDRSVLDGEQRQNRFDVVFRQISVSSQKRDEFVENAFDSLDRFGFSAEKDLVSSSRDPCFRKGVFDAFEIDVVEAEEKKGLGFLDQDLFFSQVRLFSLLLIIPTARNTRRQRMTLPTPKPLVVEFTKMTGAGNDFIVLDNRFFQFTTDELSRFAAKYCPRRSSVGADGLLALEESPLDGCDYRMVYYNADGSRGSMCGNGARCLARFAVSAGIPGPDLTFETDAGTYRARVADDPREPVLLFLPSYENYRPACRMLEDEELSGPVDYIWTGTDHAVVFVDTLQAAPVQRLGPLLRSDDEISTDGSNVDFVEVHSSGNGGEAVIRVRTYERGVEAETDACGTGAVAAALVSLLSGRTEARATRVEMPGGILRVRVDGPVSEPVELVLEGPADVVYRGTLDLWSFVDPAVR